MIDIKSLSKEFRLYHKRSGIIKDLLGFAKEDRDYHLVHSLKDLSVQIPKGEVHGIIGMNGAGKSTLLKILTGVLDPSSGSVSMTGRVAALLELGTGFHPELTGRENIFVNGTIMGFSREEISSRLEGIVKFAELGAFFDRPIKIYSSGMYVRLAFSFAIAINPEILIIDEALSVGDAYFQQKCLQKIKEFKKSGTTILFVSHDLGAVKSLCHRVTLLSKGETIFTGSPMKALDLYNDLLSSPENQITAKEKARHIETSSSLAPYESGTRDFTISSVAIHNETGSQVSVIEAGQEVEIRVTAQCNTSRGTRPTCGILLKDRLGYDIFGVNSHHLKTSIPPIAKGREYTYRFKMKLNLGPGDYALTAALHEDATHISENYHWLERAQMFKVIPSNDFQFIGIAKLSPTCEVQISPNN